MKIGYKLTLGFIGLAMLMAVFGYVCLHTSQTALEESIGKNVSDLSEQILDKISRNISRRVEETQVYATSELAKECIALSNTQFENMSDPNSYIAQIDRDWANGADLPIIQELTNNKLAKNLQAKQNYYHNKYGYSLLGEIFVTNRFGVNVAQTNRTTNYYQADEKWWQVAKKDGLFVSDVNYDESSGTFSSEIAVRIDDTNGNFIGVIKVVPNTRETANILDEAKLAAEYKTLQLHLITNNGKIVYSTKGYKYGRDATSQIGNNFANADYPKQKLYIIDKNGHLLTITRSKKLGDLGGLGWTLVTETDTAEIFAPIIALRNTMLLAGVVIIGLALLAGSITYRSVVVPIAELQKATIQIASGNLDTNLAKSGSGEISQFANSFQRMAQRLKKTIDDLNDEVNGRKKTEENLRQNEQFLGNIFDNFQDGISILNKDLNIIKVNAWMEKTFRESMPLVGKKCFKAYHKLDSVCPDCPLITILQTGLPSKGIVSVACHGTEWVEISASAIKDKNGNIMGVIEQVKDITERKKAEQELERLNKELEATVQELSISNRQLNDFVHVAAHDLKTPVRGIGTLADWIINDYGDKLDNQGREQVRLLKTRVVRIDKLIDGMLQFSKITRTMHGEKQVNLNAVLSDIKGTMPPSDHVEIAVDSMPTITCEREHIELIFHNLLTNAVTFMDKTNGLVKVGCVEQGDFWKFYVSDNGPGIEQKYFEKIFRIFQTLPKNDESETTGMGLAIARKIVELYGGKIWVESQPGSGSTFYFTFPRAIIEDISYAATKTSTAC
jgi:two-component system, LuxR family, sensor kinase FixL